SDLAHYVEYWRRHIDDHRELPAEEWPAILRRLAAERIVSRGYPRRFSEEIGNRASVHPRPGLAIARSWPLSTAQQLDLNAQLVSAVRSATDHALAVIGE